MRDEPLHDRGVTTLARDDQVDARGLELRKQGVDVPADPAAVGRNGGRVHQ
ncbi:hypothetical protein [Cellulomonas hominis]|uniref:hypothetical protein n=1 Tax=Cellulomonas hominis TaxID=156981 RepID=UPI001FF7B29B|nr:hypothetical protein [Cellulomonas hominis]